MTSCSGIRCALFFLAAVSAACGTPEESHVEAEAEPGAAIEDTVLARPVAERPPLPVTQVARSEFPHYAHGEISCRLCHENVRGHARHAQLECTDCHVRGAGEGGQARVTRAQCDACHHGRNQTRTCLDCHGEAPTAPTRVAAGLRIAGRPATQRELPFDHAVHGAIRCAQCHVTGEAGATPASCASCHALHHRADRQCSACHPPFPLERHNLRAHRGCGGSGCHTDATVVALELTRPVCLACHSAQVDHEPGGVCTRCHVMDAPGTPGPGRTGGVRPATGEPVLVRNPSLP